MPPKKKGPEVAGPSASNPPPLEQTGGGDGTGGGTGVAKPAHGAAASEHTPTRLGAGKPGMTRQPFALFHGAGTVSPTDLAYGPPRVFAHAELEQEQLRRDDALLLEEDRLQAAVRAARYQQALRCFYSRKVSARSLEEVGRPLPGETSR